MPDDHDEAAESAYALYMLTAFAWIGAKDVNSEVDQPFLEWLATANVFNALANAERMRARQTNYDRLAEAIVVAHRRVNDENGAVGPMTVEQLAEAITLALRGIGDDNE